MSVKSSQSGARMLAVLETIATEQPIGASALARQLREDKSAIQRSIVTLLNAGWIKPTEEPPVRWELSARLFAIAHLPQSSEDLRQRSRRILEDLRDRTGETAFLAIPDYSRFLAVEVAESRHMLRMVPRIGEIISPHKTATGRALLPYYDALRQETLLGHPPSPEEQAEFAAGRQQGYGLSTDEIMHGATTMAAPVFGIQGQPLAAVAITGPSERISQDRYEEFGALLIQAATQLSRSLPAREPGLERHMAANTA